MDRQVATISKRNMRAERQRAEQIKRKRARRRRVRLIRALLRNTLILAFVLVIGALSWNFIQGTFFDTDDGKAKEGKNGDVSSQEQETNEVMQYSVGTPIVREANEIANRLKSLSQQYPEFLDIYENRNAYPQDLIASLCNNPEMIDFVKGYLNSDGSVTGGLTKKERSKDFPLLLQWDKRWGYASYGGSNIALAGCAPTCLSMVAIGLTRNEEITPDKVADFAMNNGYYLEGTGTKWTLMTQGSSHFGIKAKELKLDRASVMSELQNGHPIICSLRPGDFTTAGHFIVLVGIHDGKIRVNDPNCKERSNKLWDYDTLESQIKNLWVFIKL